MSRLGPTILLALVILGGYLEHPDRDLTPPPPITTQGSELHR